MSANHHVITDLRTRLNMMTKISQSNRDTAKECGDEALYEYYKGEIEGVRLALAVLQELINHHSK